MQWIMALVIAGTWGSVTRADSGTRYSASALVGQALAEHPRVAALRARLDATRHFADQAGAWPNPEITGALGRSRAGTAAGASLEASISQPLPVTGRIGAGRRAARAEADRAQSELRAGEIETAAGTLRQAYAWVLSRRLAAFAETRQRRFEVVREYLAGQVFASPQRKAESRIVEHRLRALTLDHVRIDADVEAAWARLTAYVALPGLPETGLDLPWLAGTGTWSDEGVVARALEANPALSGQRAAVATAAADRDLAARAAWPDPAIIAFTSRNGADESRATGGGLGITVPLFDRRRGLIRGLDARRRAEEAGLAAGRREVEAGTRAALAELRAARQAAAGFPASLFDTVTSQLTDADQAFQRGQLDLLTYLELDQEASDTFQRVLGTQRDLLERALAVFELSDESDMPAALARL